MSRDPRDQALDRIQDIANLLPTEYDLQEEVREYVRRIEALARHRDIPSCVETEPPAKRVSG